MKLSAAIENQFSKDSAKCSRCSRVLSRYDYGFDALGRTLEVCPRCGPMLLVRRTEVLLRPSRKAPEPSMVGACAECGNPMEYAGTGGVPVRCRGCQDEHRRVRQMMYKREKSSEKARLVYGHQELLP